MLTKVTRPMAVNGYKTQRVLGAKNEQPDLDDSLFSALNAQFLYSTPLAWGRVAFSRARKLPKRAFSR